MPRSCTLSLAVLGLLAGVSRSQDTTKKPSGPPPRLVALSKVDREAVAFTITETRYVPVVVQKEVQVNVGGMIQKQKVNVTEHVAQLVEVPQSLKGAKVQTAGGQKLTVEEALKKLSPGSLVLLSVDNNPVDPAYLRVFKEEVLVIVPAPPAPPMPGN